MNKYAWTTVQTTSEVFHSYLNELEKDKRNFIDEKVVADHYFLAMHICSEDVIGGFALEDNGELKALFSLREGMGRNIFSRQLRIGLIHSDRVFLNCIGEFLKEFYESFGFKEYKMARWDERLAPPDWNTERFGMPNVYYMEREKECQKKK